MYSYWFGGFSGVKVIEKNKGAEVSELKNILDQRRPERPGSKGSV